MKYNTHHLLPQRVLLAGSESFSVVFFHSCLSRLLAWVDLHLALIRFLKAFDFIEDPTERVNFDGFHPAHHVHPNGGAEDESQGQQCYCI